MCVCAGITDGGHFQFLAESFVDEPQLNLNGLNVNIFLLLVLHVRSISALGKNIYIFVLMARQPPSVPIVPFVYISTVGFFFPLFLRHALLVQKK